MSPYELPLRVLSNNKKHHNQLAGPTPVPNLDDVQPFMSVPDFVEKPGPELQALLRSQHIRNPYPYPGNIDVLPSYRAEPPDSVYSKSLREHAKHALAHSWRYDPFRCSVKGALQLPQDLASKPNHGLTEDEYNWATRRKLRTLEKVRSAARDVEQAIKVYKWADKTNKHDDVNSLDVSDLDQELSDFYGPNGTDVRPIDDYSDEGFFEPNPLSITIVSLPNKSLIEEGVTPGGIFQDSGISMDEGYAEYSRAHSLPDTAKGTTGNVPGDWPRFNADVAPLRTPKKKGRWLGLVGDQKECEWPGRCQGPYDLDDLCSHDTNQTVDGPSNDTTHEHPLPAEIILSNQPMQYAQEVSELFKNEPPKDAPQCSGREQPPLPLSNNKNPIITQEIENNEASAGAAHSTSKERPHYLDGHIEDGGNSGPSVSAPHVVSEGLQRDSNANTNPRRTRFTTPVKRRTAQIHQVRIETPKTPETVNIHLTPEHSGDVGAVGGSNRSLEGQVPDSPTTETQKGQSAFSRYVQETKWHPDLPGQNSSAMSLDGSESEEDPLTSAQKRPGPSEVPTTFSKAVRLHQKRSDAMFTLSPPKALTSTPSPSKRAPIPVTPAYLNDPASFRPSTPPAPFQLGTPARPDLDSPGTPTPAPKASKKRKEKSVMNVFRSPKLGSRSPEHAPPTSEIVVAPYTPTASATDPNSGASFIRSQGLLFQQAKTNERGTKKVLNSLKLSPERRGGGGSECEAMEDEYEDELAGPGVASGGRKVASAAVVSPRVRCHDEIDEGPNGLDQESQKKKKKARRSTRL